MKITLFGITIEIYKSRPDPGLGYQLIDTRFTGVSSHPLGYTPEPVKTYLPDWWKNEKKISI